VKEYLSDEDQVIESAELVLQGRRRRHLFSQRFIYHLRDIVWDPRSGLPFINDRPILESQAVPVEHVLHLAPSKLKPTKRISAPATGLSSNGYYHWLIEQLPAALRAREVCESLSVIRWSNSPEYVATASNLFFWRTFTTEKSVQVSDYWLAGQGRDDGQPHPRDVAILRRETEGVRANPAGRRLFVPRATFARAPTGETELGNLLAREHGFRIFRSEGMVWLDQIREFSEADIVIGVHGAALANLSFCAPGTRVIEIMPLTRVVVCFANLARILRLRYRSVLVGPVPGNDFGDLQDARTEILRLLAHD
jgi:hypothetical protein